MICNERSNGDEVIVILQVYLQYDDKLAGPMAKDLNESGARTVKVIGNQ